VDKAGHVRGSAEAGELLAAAAATSLWKVSWLSRVREGGAEEEAEVVPRELERGAGRMESEGLGA
jgi:hypothetical protein